MSLLALFELGFCSCHTDCCRVVAVDFMQRLLIVELVLQDRDLPHCFVDETAELVDMAIFSGN